MDNRINAVSQVVGQYQQVASVQHNETWRVNDVTQFMLAALMVKQGVTVAWITSHRAEIQLLLDNRDLIPGGPS